MRENNAPNEFGMRIFQFFSFSDPYADQLRKVKNIIVSMKRERLEVSWLFQTW